jgi:hypothetical protein
MKVGKYTYAFVDLDEWLWAIVTDYKGPQEFGEVICAFQELYQPELTNIEKFMKALP